jgi:threonylcarbamoyladenosine tRNA methylthiotransferase MtaB
MQAFLKKGYKIVNFEEKADIYIVNTCTVTNMSDRKSRQILRKAKQKNKDSILVATGCYAQTAENALEEIEDIDIILGNSEKGNIFKYIEEYKNQKQTKVPDIMKERKYQELGTTTYTEKTRAVIKIEDGCDNFCTYCIIPFARGPVRSRALNSILEEIQANAQKGIKEVVLTGIQIASYGKDLKENIQLIDLLEEINKIKGIERIRLGSLDINQVTNQFIERIKKLEKICPHFHLSLQSGCTETLKRMNRKYTKEDIEEVVKKLRKTFSEVILTADIIAGFPRRNRKRI